jgi:hypothetical protein
MRKFLLAIAVITTMTACKKNKQPQPRPTIPYEETYVYQENMRVDSTKIVSGMDYDINDSGKQDVLLYRYTTGMNNNIYDDEYTFNIWIPTDSGATKFNYVNGQLKEHLCFYESAGAWTGEPATLLDKGTIYGIKNSDGSWDVTIDVTLQRKSESEPIRQINRSGRYYKGSFYK